MVRFPPKPKSKGLQIVRERISLKFRSGRIKIATCSLFTVSISIAKIFLENFGKNTTPTSIPAVAQLWYLF
jgi:hypothetical protein